MTGTIIAFPGLVSNIAIAFLFYRNMATASTVITVCIAYEFWISHTFYFLPYVITVRLLATALLLLYVRIFRKDRFYFFNNLGLSNNALYLSALIFDILIAGILLVGTTLLWSFLI